MENTKKYNVIEHSNWKFEYSGTKSIYNNIAKNEKYFMSHTEPQQIKLSNSNEISIQNFRKAGTIHKLIRSILLKQIKADVSFLQLANEAKMLVEKFVRGNENAGFAFPLGISVNEIAAHDSAMIDDNRILKKNDIVKIDLGIHVNGCIVDSAFTVIVEGDEEFINMYTPLLESTADATYTAIAMARPDVQLKEISTSIKEVIESYELADGRKISAVWGLGGHNILPYKVHGGKLILSVPHSSQDNQRMQEDEIYAIETFASTGNGYFSQKSICECNHFMLNDNKQFLNKITTTKNPVALWALNKNNNLPFTQLWCTEIKRSTENFDKGLKDNIIVPYPPLYDNIGTYTSQLEHTIHIKENSTEILTLGDDY